MAAFKSRWLYKIRNQGWVSNDNAIASALHSFRTQIRHLNILRDFTRKLAPKTIIGAQLFCWHPTLKFACVTRSRRHLAKTDYTETEQLL